MKALVTRLPSLVIVLAGLAAGAREPITAEGAKQWAEVCPPLSMDEATAATEALVFTNAAGATLPYRQYVPADLRDGERVPLVLLLHGAGERGTDNRMQLVHGGRQLLAWGREWKLPFVLVAPQCPGGKQWVDTPWGALAHTMPERPSETLALAMELLDDRLAALPVDPDRVYATGVSMGGYGVWDLLQRRPGFFAAAVPVCGGGDTNLASRLVSVPIRAFHGKADGVVPPFRSRSMVDAIRAAGGALAELDEYPGVGHDSWNRAYGDPSTLDWLFAQRRGGGVSRDPATGAPGVHATARHPNRPAYTFNPWDAPWIFVSPATGVVDAGTKAPDGPADLSFAFRCAHSDKGLWVHVAVFDDDLSADTCPTGAVSCAAWDDDAVEIFLDGELARLPDSRADGGVRLRHGGEFALVANGAANSDFSGYPRTYAGGIWDKRGGDPPPVWWAGDAVQSGIVFGESVRNTLAPGLVPETAVEVDYFFWFPWSAMGRTDKPDRIGFNIGVQDDDGGGRRDHALYWTGNPRRPFSDESAFGILVLDP